MSKKVGVILGIVAVVFLLTGLVLLVPVERKRLKYEKWGRWAEIAETDPRAEYIIEHEEEFPKDVLNMLNEYNDETREKSINFIYNYPTNKNDYEKMSFTDVELNCDAVPQLYMSDPRWCYETMDGGFIYSSGCMLVSLTMANLYLNHNSNVDPKIAATVAENLGIVDVFGGISGDVDTTEFINALGMDCEIYDFTDGKTKTKTVDIQTIQDIISSGNVCMAGFVGDTFGGHVLIITSCTDDGVITINDPASPENTAKTWNFYDIETELYRLWNIN